MSLECQKPSKQGDLLCRALQGEEFTQIDIYGGGGYTASNLLQYIHPLFYLRSFCALMAALLSH